MKKPLIVISLIFLTASFSFAASGQGLTSWDAQIEPVASSDLVGITDISDTTQSDNGSSKKATMTQVGAFMATLFTSKTGNETIAGIKTFTSSPIVPTPTTDMQVATKKYVDDNSGTGTVNVVQTVSPTGSTSSAPSESAVGIGLASKQNTADVQEVSADVEAMLESANNAEILSNIGAAPAGTTGATSIDDLTDWPTGVTATELGYVDGVTSSIQSQINSLTVGAPVVAVPTYSDEACTAGVYSLSTSPLRQYICFATGDWNYIDSTGLVDWDNPAPVTESTTFFLDFEGTEAEDLAQGGTWTKDFPAGIFTLDYTDGPIAGSQSLRIVNDAGGTNYLYSPLYPSPVDTVYYSYSFKMGSTTSSIKQGFGAFGTLDASVGMTIYEGGLKLKQGTTASAGIPISTGSTYYICGKVVSSSGSNDGMHIARVGTDSNYNINPVYGITNGTNTDLIKQVYMAQYSSNSLTVDDWKTSTEVLSECGDLSL